MFGTRTLHIPRTTTAAGACIPKHAPLREVTRQAAMTRLAAHHTRDPSENLPLRGVRGLLAAAAPRLPDVFADQAEQLAAAGSALKACQAVGGALIAEGAMAVDVAAHTSAVLTRQPHVQRSWPSGGAGVHAVVLVSGALYLHISFPARSEDGHVHSPAHHAGVTAGTDGKMNAV